MEDPNTLLLITPKSIRNTIIEDGHTRLWFERFLLLPAIKDYLEAENVSAKDYYQGFQALTKVSWVTALGLAGLLLSGFVFLNDYKMLLLGVVVAGAAAFWIISRKKAVLLGELGAILVEIRKGSIRPGVTLYQFTERCSKEFDFPSLVDNVFLWNYLVRASVIILFILSNFIFFLPFWKGLFVIAGGYFATMVLLKIAVLHRKQALYF